jgi:hypothetical protein
LDNHEQHLRRCYEHAIEPIVSQHEHLAEVFLAASPSLGRLFAAREEDFVEMAGCSLDEASAVVAILQQTLKSQ